MCRGEPAPEGSAPAHSQPLRGLLTSLAIALLLPVVARSEIDLHVNDPALDSGNFVQSETSIRAANGRICVAHNEFGGPIAAIGFSSSGDLGQSFTDHGVLTGPKGDPALAYSTRDGLFYFTSNNQDIRTSATCTSFSFISQLGSPTAYFDKPLITVDNSPTSPFYGRIYVGFTDDTFATQTRDGYVFSSDSGTSWTKVVLPGSGQPGKPALGLWPTTAPNGDLYVSFVNYAFAQFGSLETQRIYRSQDGGVQWIERTSISEDRLRGEKQTATMNCNGQALNGNIRLLESAQIAIQKTNTGIGYTIHSVYSYDPDGPGADNVSVFYRRSTNGAQSWSAELQLNDDTTSSDQFYPAIDANDAGVIAVSWYDRRVDPNSNLLFARFASLSFDGGITWQSNVQVSDVASPVYSPASCYHGDYDQVDVEESIAHFVWSDDRGTFEIQPGSFVPNPDVYYESIRFARNCDINENGALDAGDLVLAMRALKGDLLLTPQQTLNADLAPRPGGDGAFNVSDALLMLRALGGASVGCE